MSEDKEPQWLLDLRAEHQAERRRIWKRVLMEADEHFRLRIAAISAAVICVVALVFTWVYPLWPEPSCPAGYICNPLHDPLHPEDPWGCDGDWDPTTHTDDCPMVPSTTFHIGRTLDSEAR